MDEFSELAKQKMKLQTVLRKIDKMIETKSLDDQLKNSIKIEINSVRDLIT